MLKEMSLFSNTLSILHKAESLMVDVPSHAPLYGWPGKALGKLIKNVLSVKPFMSIGFRLLFSILNRWICMTLGLFILLFLFNLAASQGRMIWQPFILYASILALPVILFSLPSTYVANGIKPDVINKLTEYIYELNVNTIERVELVEKSIEKLKNRALSRDSIYKWYVVTTWGGVVFFLSIFVKEIALGVIKGQSIQTGFVDGATASVFILAVLFVNVVPMILFSAYKKVVDCLYMTIELSLLETKVRLIEESKK